MQTLNAGIFGGIPKRNTLKFLTLPFAILSEKNIHTYWIYLYKVWLYKIYLQSNTQILHHICNSELSDWNSDLSALPNAITDKGTWQNVTA